MREKFRFHLNTVILALGGALALIEGVLEIFTDFHLPLLDKGPAEITLTMTGLVAIMLAIDYTKLDRKLDRIEGVMAAGLGGRLLHGEYAVYGAALQSVSTARRSIRAVIWGQSPRAPEWFMKGVAGRLKETKDHGNPITYEVIFIANPARLPPGFVEGVERRFEMFRSHGVEEQATLKISRRKTGLASICLSSMMQTCISPSRCCLRRGRSRNQFSFRIVQISEPVSRRGIALA